MVLDVSRIDERIRKLQIIREMAADPEFVSLFTEFISTNGAGKKRATAHKGGNYTARKGSFTEAVLESCKAFGAATFTARDVQKRVQERKYHIEAKNPYTAVLGIMKKLVDRGFLRVTEASGRNPYVYSNVETPR
jgi:hypothetical protein